MTRFRPITTWLLLIPFACWAGGATRFAHESLEHGQAAHPANDRGAAHHPDESPEHPDPDHPSQHDCPTCTALAGMYADASIIATALPCEAAVDEYRLTPAQSASTSACTLPPPPRGPPVA